RDAPRRPFPTPRSRAPRNRASRPAARSSAGRAPAPLPGHRASRRGRKPGTCAGAQEGKPYRTSALTGGRLSRRTARPEGDPPMKRILVLALTAFAAHADEGMWTYDNFPSAKVAKGYGFTPDAKWLEEARLSSVRLAGGCSGSFVSQDGLVMTNHHCAHHCIEHLST